MAKKIPLDPAAIARRQLQILLAVDCSGSMQGDRIASLNYAMRTALPELRSVAADNPEVDVRMSVLRFASTAEWQIEAPEPVENIQWTDLTAEGETHLGDALRLLADRLTPAAMPGRQLPPILVLASDGYPTDDFESGFDAFFAAELTSSAIRLAIAIGSDADNEILGRFIRHPELKPLKANNATDLVKYIKWATTAPVKAASSPTNSPDPLKAFAQEIDENQPVTSDIIW
ncbi:VWA domain-containing protein [Sneathiella chungangensis]|uniref:VWA domain-containing protein n=1 Tax=Sneathiella chungangensis TaxID=1418234 RepID=A0A845MAJ0_9PROT|nr:VWA domain-containing protein [Sneathiella chungangensis]MZR20911.1 VWA domain-containing protein [Sneathiella chungangensis]